MIYVALGDSITHGYDSSKPAHRYVDQLTEKLNQMNVTHAYVNAKPGYTAPQLLASMEKIPPCILAESTLTTVMIGGNDLLRVLPWYLNDPEEGRRRLETTVIPVVREILEKAKPSSHTILLLCTIYNPFPNSDLAARGVGDYNDMLARLASECSCELVRIDDSYQGRESELVNGYRRGALEDYRLIKNPIHPNDRGHARIAEAIFHVYKKRAREMLVAMKKKTGDPVLDAQRRRWSRRSGGGVRVNRKR